MPFIQVVGCLSRSDLIDLGDGMGMTVTSSKGFCVTLGVWRLKNVVENYIKDNHRFVGYYH